MITELAADECCLPARSKPDGANHGFSGRYRITRYIEFQRSTGLPGYAQGAFLPDPTTIRVPAGPCPASPEDTVALHLVEDRARPADPVTTIPCRENLYNVCA